MGEVGPEFDRDGENQAGLNQLVERFEKIRKCQARYGVREWSNRGLHSVAGKINPLQKVSNLVSANAESDLKHFRIGHLLTHGCVKARSALLNLSEVKGRHIRDRLNVIVALKIVVVFAFVIGIGSGNGGYSVERQRLRKGGTEVRIGGAAVANVPTGVDVKLHEVGEAQLT